MRSFGARLDDQFREGRRLCVGIDPHEYLLDAWGLPNSASGAERMAHDILDASVGEAAAVKPQVAFFERFGADGYRVLEGLLERSRSLGMLVIADAKRGDVGSSFEAYADAWLSPGSPLEADALTVNPFQGFGILSRAVEHCRLHHKGLFVLAATSNPEAFAIQSAQLRSGESVSASILDEIDAANSRTGERVGSIGAVLGATLRLEDFHIATAEQPTAIPVMPVLAPGFGHQGGTLDAVREGFGRYLSGLLVNESRSLCEGGADQIQERIQRRSAELTEHFMGV